MHFDIHRKQVSLQGNHQGIHQGSHHDRHIQDSQFIIYDALSMKSIKSTLSFEGDRNGPVKILCVVD